MEHYYFIQKNGIKQGPYNLAELKLQTIYFDELIWRSDNSQWKKASEFEELQGVFIINPPPTPKEQKIYEVNYKFKYKVIKEISLLYILTCIIVSVLSFLIAQSSWNKYLKDTEGKYLPNNQASSIEEGRPPLISEEEYQAILNDPNASAMEKLQAASDASDFRKKDDGFITYKELKDNQRYQYYTKGINNESSYGYGQGFIFRPFMAFFSTLYLTDEEQENPGILFKNLTLSSFFSLSFVFLIAGSLYYLIKRNNINDEMINSNENN